MCIVPGCESSDVKVLSHRFPRNRDRAETWQTALALHEVDLNELMDKYIVCKLHFTSSDYRHSESKFLNTTAVPKMGPMPDQKRYFIVLDEGKQMAFNAPTAKRGAAQNSSEPEPDTAPDKTQKIDLQVEDDAYWVYPDEDECSQTTEALLFNEKLLGGCEKGTQTTESMETEEEDVDAEFKQLSKHDLIKALVESRKEVLQLKTTIENFKTAKTKMLQTIQDMSC